MLITNKNPKKHTQYHMLRAGEYFTVVEEWGPYRRVRMRVNARAYVEFNDSGTATPRDVYDDNIAKVDLIKLELTQVAEFSEV